MDPVAAKYIGAGLACFGMAGTALGLGNIFGSIFPVRCATLPQLMASSAVWYSASPLPKLWASSRCSSLFCFSSLFNLNGLILAALGAASFLSAANHFADLGNARLQGDYICLCLRRTPHPQRKQSLRPTRLVHRNRLCRARRLTPTPPRRTLKPVCRISKVFSRPSTPAILLADSLAGGHICRILPVPVAGGSATHRRYHRNPT